MGQRGSIASMNMKLDYCVQDGRARGRPRYYVRIKGQKIRLNSPVDTPEFYDEYWTARRALEQSIVNGGANQPKRRIFIPKTLGWLIDKYLKESPGYRSMASTGRKRRERILCAMQDTYGDKPMIIPRDSLSAGFTKRLQDSPKGGAANEWLKSVKALYSWSVDIGILDKNPAESIKKLRLKTDGYHIWSLDEITTFVCRHPKGSLAYCAVMLFLFTGLRRDDASKLGPQHIKDGAIRFRTGKTKEELITALAPPLAEALLACGPGTDFAFLRNNLGKKFASGNALGNWFKDRCREAGLDHCTAHGLRKAAASIAAEEGASDMVLDAMFSWSQSGDNNQSRTYTRNASKLRLSTEGFALIERVLARSGIISVEQKNNKSVSV